MGMDDLNNKENSSFSCLQTAKPKSLFFFRNEIWCFQDSFKIKAQNKDLEAKYQSLLDKTQNMGKEYSSDVCDPIKFLARIESIEKTLENLLRYSMEGM